MNIAAIESRIRELVEQPFEPGKFACDFLTVFENIPKATLTKLRQGAANKATGPGELLWKGKLFFRPAEPGKAMETVDGMAADPLTKRHSPQFLMATDGAEVFCRDLRADQSISVDYAKLNDPFDFFLPLAGIERYEAVVENPADVKATGRLARLYDAVLDANPGWASGGRTHELNLFMTRLLFCFFAEDTSIFEKGLFTKTLVSTTSEDGSDAAAVLDILFLAMDTRQENRANLPEYARRFPFVNGGLFRERTPVPAFSKRARRLLKECGDLVWKEINPDIFGSMIQAVVEPGMRGDMGMHYTSVPNIMKVLQPLFLLSLEEEFEAARDSEAKLKRLLDRLYRIRVFDPACGSGNFLIIAYRELRKLENRVFARLKELAQQWSLPMTGIRLNHFFGIELADFAAETAKLSLWIAEYQVNEQFKAMFGSAPPALPLQDSGCIVCDNATRLDWLKVCPPVEGAEIYIVGNPPYLGGKKLSKQQSEDMVAAGLKKMKQVDYIGCWFVKAADYAEQAGNQFAFVTTNSVCQGEQVHLLWSHLFGRGFDISFAYEPFKWSNNASNKATVACTIIGVKPQQLRRDKVIFDGTHGRTVKNISPYVAEGANAFVSPSRAPLFELPPMVMGSNPVDGKRLILTKKERDALLASDPTAERFVRRYMGGKDFISGTERFCLWIPDNQVEAALEIPFVFGRLQACRSYRQTAGRDARKMAEKPHRFCYRTHQDAAAVIVPVTSAESRRYLPCGFTDDRTVVNHDAFAIYDPQPYVLALLSSTVHRVWLAAVGGSLEMRYRYSVKLVYNTFPVPTLSAAQKQVLEEHAWDIVARREAHPGRTVGQLYDPERMPPDLLKAHRALDETLEHIYVGRCFRSDTERLEHLFRMYGLLLRKRAA